jgi:hypothetical protein
MLNLTSVGNLPYPVDLSNYLTPDPTLFVFLEKLKEFQIDTCENTKFTFGTKNS